MKRILTILTIAMLLISSLSIVASSSIPIDGEKTEDNHQEYDESDNFLPLSINEDIYNLPSLDMSNLPVDYNGGFFAVDQNGGYIDTVDLFDFNSGVFGDLGMAGMSGEMGETDTDDTGDGQEVPDGVIGCSMDFIDFPPMTKGDICNKSEIEVLKEYDRASKVDPDGFHVYNPLAFKTFNISHPLSYPDKDNVDVVYNIEIKYTGDHDLELAAKGKGWINATPNCGELLYDASPHWWESDAEQNEDQITVKINITKIQPGRHTASIVIHSYYYIVDRDTDYSGSPDYTYNTTIPLSVNIWSDSINESSLKYSILGGESVYKYDVGRIRANDPFSLVVDVWNAGPENTTSFYTVEPDLMISGAHDYVLYSEVIRDFHRIINNVIVVEPYFPEERYVGPERFRASQGEHDYLRIKINVTLFLCKMQGLNTDFIDQAWIRNCPTISISNLIKDIQNPTFAFKITSLSGESFWFEISYSTKWTGGNWPDVIITELASYSPKVVPQGETLHLMDVIAWNPCPVALLDDFDTAIGYNFGGILASVDPNDPYINNPPPKDSWIEGDHVHILPSRGIIEYGGNPGGDNLQNKKGRDIINFYVDTTGLEPGDYILYTAWLATCAWWTGITSGQDPFGEEGCQGIGLAPAITPSKCIFTVKPADWTPEEPVNTQIFTPQTMVLDNLDANIYQNIGEILECIGYHNIIYQYGPEFPELNVKEFKIENNGDNTVVYGETLPNVLVTDDSLMFDIYPKKPFDICPMPTDKVIIIPRSDGYKTPLSNDTDSSFEERGGHSGLFAPFIANPFDIYDQLAFINGEMTHIEPPPLYKNIKVQVLNPVDGEWDDIQDPRRRNPHTGDWISQLEDVPVGTTLTYRIEVFIRDFRDGLDGCNDDMAGYGNLGWPLQIEDILPESLEYEENSAKTRLGAWWKMRDPMSCGGGGEDLIDPDESNCFLKGTRILMADSTTKNIEEIVIGDLVKSFNEGKDGLVNGEVIQVFHHGSEETEDNYLVINNDLKVTPNHPIYKDGIWIPAIDLRKGDVLKFKDNTYKINSIKKVFEKVPTYNFEVRTHHNYIISTEEGSLLVHNKNIDIDDAYNITNCFLESTQISMADNSYKDIEDIAVGDFVKSYDEQTKNIVEGRVNKVFNHDKEIMADHYLIINEDLRLTPDHPIYKDGRWIVTDDLIVGDIIGFDGNFYEISSIEKIFEQVTTYNFEVEKYHNYMVRSQDCDVLVHNGGSYHPEYEGEFYFSWAEKFTPFEPSINCNNLIWNLPTGKLIKIVEIPGVPWYKDCDFSLFDQPTCHPHAGSSPIWPYHPTETWAVSTTGAVAVEIVFNATITDEIDVDEIITNNANIKVLDFYDHYYSNQEIQQINNDTASVTLKNSNLPPDKPEILSPFDGETGLSVKYTDELLVRVTDPDNDLMSVSFYWTDKPRFSICMDPRRVSDGPGSGPAMIDAPVATAYEFGCHGTRIETIYNVASGSIISVDPRPIAYFDEKLFAAAFGHANIKYLEYDTQYEWYVVVKDMKDTVRSDISSFSTDNKPPEADFTVSPEKLHTGELITFDASTSHDPDDLIFDYMWTYEPLGGFVIPGNGRDGNPIDGDRNIPDGYTDIDPIHDKGIIGTGEKIEYLFSEPGEYEVKLHVCYNRHGSLSYGDHLYVPNFVRNQWPYYSTVTKIIVVDEGTEQNNNPPVAEFNYNPLHPEPAELITFDASDSYDSDGEIVEYSWSFTTAGGTQLPIDIGTEVATSCTWNEAGDYNVTLTVVDNENYESTTSKIIHVYEDNNNGADDGPPADEGDSDYTTCNIKIIKPLDNYLYIRNEKKIPFFIPLIIGDIDINTTITDPDNEIKNVKFYINGEEKSSTDDLIQETCRYYWKEKTISWKTIEVIATDADGKQIASDSIDVIMFNLEG